MQTKMNVDNMKKDLEIQTINIEFIFILCYIGCSFIVGVNGKYFEVKHFIVTSVII